jgi:hypothetical protein
MRILYQVQEEEVHDFHVDRCLAGIPCISIVKEKREG